MTKPRVISKAAMRRAKRKGITYVLDLAWRYDKHPNVRWEDVPPTVLGVDCGVYQHKRTDKFYGDYYREFTLMPIGRGGNRKGHIDWSTASYEEQQDDLRREYWADQF